MVSDLAVAVASVVATFFAFTQWRSMKVEARSAEMDLLRQMHADWLALKPQWHRAILTAIGPDSYYSPAELEIRNKFRDLIKRIAVDEPELKSDDWHRWHQKTRDASHEFQQAQRDVLFFFATLASEVFRGRLSPALAYDVVGLDVTRRSRQVRVLLGYERARWEYEPNDKAGPEEVESQDAGEEPESEDDEMALLKMIEDMTGMDLNEVNLDEALNEIKRLQDERVFDCPWDYWVDSSPGLTDRILGLLDVLWAQSAKLHDIETHDLVLAAQIKRDEKTGARNRRRTRRLCWEHGARWTGFKLERFLLNCEFLSLGPPRQVRFLSLEQVPRRFRGWGLFGRLRKLWAFLAGRLRRARRSRKVTDPTGMEPDLKVLMPKE